MQVLFVLVQIEYRVCNELPWTMPRYLSTALYPHNLMFAILVCSEFKIVRCSTSAQSVDAGMLDE